MKINRKISIIFIYILFSISLISQFPASSGVHISYPIAGSSLNSSSEPTISDYFKSYFGHDLDEEYWSIIYDFAGNQTVQDFNPGRYEDLRYEGVNDSDPDINANFYMGWNNLRNVHSFYFAMQNYTWNSSNVNDYGCAPYQYFLQHFRVPTTNTHVFILNKFLGLVAYQDNSSGIEDLPDENDSLYIGWPQFSELHKFLLNSLFVATEVPEKYWIDNTTIGTANPIAMNETSPGTYEFGMSYQDIFILWQGLDIEEGLDENVENIAIVNNCIAFSMISSINFTFKIETRMVNRYTEVNTTTEYDIGELSQLWVIGDDNSTGSDFGGESFNLGIGDIEIGYYNSSNEISKRLSGNENTSGFGLAIINTANIALIKMKRIFFGLIEIPDFDASGIENFTDQDGNTIYGNKSDNITQATYNEAGEQVYKIDFASKPNYTLGENEYPAPTRVLANDVVKTDITGLLDLLAIWNIALFVARAAKNDFFGLALAVAVVPQFLENEFYYLTCFPEWNGTSINQDPTFTVFIPPNLPELPIVQREQPKRNWFLTFVGGITIIVFLSIIIVLSRKAYLKYIKNRSVSIDKGAHRLTIEEVLENENRKRIIDAILEEPGIHFNDLLRKTELAPGNLVWHLDILETYKVIKKKRIGNYLIFIPYYSKNPLSNIDLKLQKSELTLKVLEMIEEDPGIWNKKITNKLKIHRKTIQYHIDKLLELGLVYRKRDGSKKRIFPNLEEEYFKDNSLLK
jgi:predicted transcriptional regulator